MRAKHQTTQEYCLNATKGLQAISQSDDAILSEAIAANGRYCAQSAESNAAITATQANETQNTLKMQQQAGMACERAAKELTKELSEFGLELKRHAGEWMKEVL